MNHATASPVFKFFAIFISVLFFFNIWLVAEIQSENPHTQNFNQAKEKFFSGDYPAARSILENLAGDLGKLEGHETLKGYTALLLGAVYEKEGRKNLSIREFCRAKEILGADRSIGGLDLSLYQNYREDCAGVMTLIQSYDEARTAYFAGDYQSSKDILEPLVARLDEYTGMDTLKGETYLLSGATYEQLKYQQPSVKYYCLAKEILGKGKSIEGLDLKDLKWYQKSCKSGVVSKMGKKRRGGGILGFVLGLAILGGIVWYLFINPNSPLKDDETETSWNEYITRYQFETHWTITINTTWSGSPGTVSYSPSSNWAPQPGTANNWDDTRTISFSASGGTLVSSQIRLEVELKGCNDGTRKDIIDINDVTKMQRTTTFANDCSAAALEANKITKLLHTQSTLADIRIRHKLDLSANDSAARIRVQVNSSVKNR